MMVLAAAAAFVGAGVQSATGFGFALILAPALFAVLGPEEAITALLITSLLLNALVLVEGIRPVRWRPLAPLLLASVPGLAAGVAVLSLLPKAALQIAVGVAVVVAALIQWRTPAPHEPREPSVGSACAVGLASGALTTSTSVNGPPIALWLQAHGARPDELRSSMAVCFLGLNLAGGVALLVGGAAVLAGAGVLLPLVGLVALGHLVGARIFRLVDQRRFRPLVLSVAIAAGAASAIAGMAAV
jgi:uncharacterized protein